MKRSDIPLEKVTMNLFAGDSEKLQDIFPRQGASFIVRNLIRAYIRKVEEDLAQKARPLELKLDLKEME